VLGLRSSFCRHPGRRGRSRRRRRRRRKRRRRRRRRRRRWWFRKSGYTCAAADAQRNFLRRSVKSTRSNLMAMWNSIDYD